MHNSDWCKCVYQATWLLFICVGVFMILLLFAEVMVKVHVVDLKSETIASPVSVRAYLNQTITEFKQLIAQVSYSSQPLHIILF